MDRFEKRKKCNQLKKFQTMKARSKLLEKLEEKKNRPKKLRQERMRQRAIQKCLAAVVAVNYNKNLQINFHKKIQQLKERKEMDKAATFLQETISSIRSKKLWLKYTEFYARVVRSRWVFMMAIRCWRRRKSVDKIKVFLVEQSQISTMSIMVSKFLKKVRRLQKFAKQFVACHRARMKILVDVWNDVESQFEKRLSERMKEARRMRPIKLSEKSEIR